MYIGRRQDNSIYGCWSNKQPDDSDHPNMEEVADDHPDLVAFLNPAPVVDKRGAAIDALLNREAAKPDAPQELKDYAEAKL